MTTIYAKPENAPIKALKKEAEILAKYYDSFPKETREFLKQEFYQERFDDPE
jgi:hypothetical protein